MDIIIPGGNQVFVEPCGQCDTQESGCTKCKDRLCGWVYNFHVVI